MCKANTPEENSFPGCFLCKFQVFTDRNMQHDKMNNPELNTEWAGKIQPIQQSEA